jgi:hypothetical protein
MRNLMIIMLVWALSSGCYQSASIRVTLEDAVPDLSVPDLSLYDDGSMDMQWDIDDMRDALDMQDGHEVLEDMMPESDETCGPAILVLQPVSFVGTTWQEAPLDCSEIGISEVRVILFRDTYLIMDATLPCLGDTIEVGPIDSGNYELAAVAYNLFVSGIDIMRMFYPQVPDCVPENIACQPLAFTIAPCGSTIIPLMLYCDDSFAPCIDCCGGG